MQRRELLRRSVVCQRESITCRLAWIQSRLQSKPKKWRQELQRSKNKKNIQNKFRQSCSIWKKKLESSDVQDMDIEMDGTSGSSSYNELNKQNKALHSRSADHDTPVDAHSKNVISYLRQSKEIAEREISLLKGEKLQLQSKWLIISQVFVTVIHFYYINLKQVHNVTFHLPLLAT